MAIFGLEHATFDPKGGSLSGHDKAQYELRLGRWADREDLIYSEFGNLPDFAQGDPVAFFAATDSHERVNGRRYTEIVLTLPSEFSDEQNKELAQEWVQKRLGTKHPHILAIHKPERLRADPEAQKLLENPDLTDSERKAVEQQFFNVHVHVLFTERELTQENGGMTAEKWFSRVGAKKDREWNKKELIPNLRKQWEEQLNSALQENAPNATRVDSRSLIEQRADAIREARMLPANDATREELIRRIAQLDRTPEGHIKWQDRRDTPKEVQRELEANRQKRQLEPDAKAIKRAREEVGLLDKIRDVREQFFKAVAQCRAIFSLVRKRKEIERLKQAEIERVKELERHQAAEAEKTRLAELAEIERLKAEIQRREQERQNKIAGLEQEDVALGEQVSEVAVIAQEINRQKQLIELLKPAREKYQSSIRVANAARQGKREPVTQGEAIGVAACFFEAKPSATLVKKQGKGHGQKARHVA